MTFPKSELFQHSERNVAKPIVRDYMMESDGLVAFTLSELPGATVFSIMRNRCMFNADESALFYVYRVLQTWENMEGNAKRQLVRKQLRKEYGMPFENVVDALDGGHPPVAPTVSTEELDAMIVFFQKTGRFSEELRNYVPGAKGKKTVTMGLQVIQSTCFISSCLSSRNMA